MDYALLANGDTLRAFQASVKLEHSARTASRSGSGFSPTRELHSEGSLKGCLVQIEQLIVPTNYNLEDEPCAH